MLTERNHGPAIPKSPGLPRMHRPAFPLGMKVPCPHCGKPINPAQLLGALGGAKGGKTTGQTKARSSASARAAAVARWAKYHAEKAKGK